MTVDMKILFVICGEGLGHASRSLYLGNYLQISGYEVHYASYGKSFDFLKNLSSARLHETNREVYIEGEDGFFSLKKTLWYSKFIPYNMLRSFWNISSLIKTYHYDCIICDTMYAGLLAARMRKIPCIFITNQNHFSGQNGQINLIWKIFNLSIWRYLKIASHILIPDYPLPNTLSEFNINIPVEEEHRYTYTGPFLEIDFTLYEEKRESIFTSFGGEPYKLPLYLMLKRIADEHKEFIFDVFYTGAPLPDSTDNFITHGYVPSLQKYLAKANLAIVHGGLTTLHEALLFEKPVLIILDPNHPEQQNNARKIIDMGAGTAVDGTKLSKKLLEEKIIETLQIKPKNFRTIYESMKGKKKAEEIIRNICSQSAK